MNWNELEQVWRTAPVMNQPSVDTAEFAARRRRMQLSLARRDWLEAAVGLGVASSFAGFLVFLGVADWRGWLAVGLVLAVSGLFVVERQRARRLRPATDAALLVQLDGEIAELRHQRRLLLRVAWWYLLPLGAATLLFVWALLDFVAQRTGKFDAAFLIKFAAVSAAVDVAIWWLNRRAVTTEIEPRLRACEAARAELAA